MAKFEGLIEKINNKEITISNKKYTTAKNENLKNIKKHYLSTKNLLQKQEISTDKIIISLDILITR